MENLNLFPKNILKIFGEEFLATVLAVAGFKSPAYAGDYGLSRMMRLKGQYDLAKYFSAQVTASFVLETGRKRIVISRLCESGASYPQRIEIFFGGHKLGQLDGYGWYWERK